MIWQLLAAAAGAACGAWLWSRRRMYRLAAELPSALKSYPIIGHAYMFIIIKVQLLNGKEPDLHYRPSTNISKWLNSPSSRLYVQSDRMTALHKIGLESNKQGGLCSVWLGHKLFISMTDPTAIEVVTKTCLDKDEFTMKFTRTVIGNGSVFAPVKIWHPRRKIMAPFFSLKNLNQIVAVFNKKSAIMADLIRTEAGRGDFSIWKYIDTYTFDSICESALGVKLNSQENPGHHYILCATNEVTEMVASRMLQPWLHPDFVYKRLPVYKLFQQHRQHVITFVDETVQMKRRELESVSPNDKNNNNNDFKSFVESSIAPSAGMVKGYSDTELREEVMVIATAGTDTSAVGASFTAVLLSRNPAVQDRVYQELKEVFGDSDRAVTPEDLPRLQYLEAVIKESLRLYPPVPVVVREIHEDVVLPSGTTLVRGTAVIIHIWGAHRNPLYWGADADQFRPERFLQGALRHPAMFIPFSYSVRGCIGATYAMRSAKTVLANLVRRYRLLPPAGARAADLIKPLPVTFSLMMKAVDDFIVRLEERN